jgi:hypothetical protein
MQCDRCAAENIFAHGREIHETTLHEWEVIERGEANSFLEAESEVLTHDMARFDLHQEPVTNFEQEQLELLDCHVEMEPIQGQVVKTWKNNKG